MNMRPIDTLTPDPANVRTHSPRNLDAIVQRWEKLTGKRAKRDG